MGFGNFSGGCHGVTTRFMRKRRTCRWAGDPCLLGPRVDVEVSEQSHTPLNPFRGGLPPPLADRLRSAAGLSRFQWNRCRPRQWNLRFRERGKGCRAGSASFGCARGMAMDRETTRERRRNAAVQ
jgi:hypothetical protein